jgi:hypothetical protein
LRGLASTKKELISHDGSTGSEIVVNKRENIESPLVAAGLRPAGTLNQANSVVIIVTGSGNAECQRILPEFS